MGVVPENRHSPISKTNTMGEVKLVEIEITKACPGFGYAVGKVYKVTATEAKRIKNAGVGSDPKKAEAEK